MLVRLYWVGFDHHDTSVSWVLVEASWFLSYVGLEFEANQIAVGTLSELEINCGLVHKV